MHPGLDISTLKQKSLQFVHLLGNEHDTTSSAIIALLADEFSVQHGESQPSTGGRGAFLNKLGERLKMAKGHASVEIIHSVAELTEGAAHGGQCWVYSRKNTPFGSSLSLDIIRFTENGQIVRCQDLHGPKEGMYSSFFSWLLEYLFGISMR